MAASKKTKDQLAAGLLDEFIDLLRVTAASDWYPFDFSGAILDAFRSVPRHIFVDQYYDFSKKKSRLVRVDARKPSGRQLRKIYSEEALVSHLRDGTPSSSTSQPSLVANMLGELEIEPGMKILEIGAGTGWNAALMGHLVGSAGEIYSVDLQADVARRGHQFARIYDVAGEIRRSERNRKSAGAIRRIEEKSQAAPQSGRVEKLEPAEGERSRVFRPSGGHDGETVGTKIRHKQPRFAECMSHRQRNVRGIRRR